MADKNTARKVISVAAPEDIYDAVDALHWELRVPRAAVVLEAITEYLDNHKVSIDDSGKVTNFVR